jgi:hypothetical protein
MWSYYRHIDTLLRVKIGTKETERYDTATQSWVCIDGNWLLKKRYDGDAFLDDITIEEATHILSFLLGDGRIRPCSTCL